MSMKTEHPSPEMILAGKVRRDTAVRQAEERAKEEENAVRVRKGRRAGTGMVHGSKKKPPNCGNSLAARCVSENTAGYDAQFNRAASETQGKIIEGVLFEKIRIQVLR